MVENFNPRARVGRDDIRSAFDTGMTSFQSTRPRRARQLLRRNASRKSNFNPRARVGRDLDFVSEHLDLEISIHAPA